MSGKLKDFTDLAARLKEYSDARKGEISKLSYDASKAINVLVAKVKELEAQIQGAEDDLK